MAVARRGTLATILWTCSALGALAVVLSVWAPYRDLVGVVTTAPDVLLRTGPALLATALHIWCAFRAASTPGTRDPIIRLCGVFDVVVGASMWVPWLGLWTSLFSPFVAMFFLASVHAPRPVGSVAYVAVSAATVGAGYWILRASRQRVRARADEGSRPSPG
jgi:hypothetical protein